MFDMPYCPNVDCPNEKPLKEDEKCPQCGKLAQKFGIGGATQLNTEKSNRRRMKEGAKEILVSDKMSDEEIKQKIFEDMMNLSMHEAGTGWMRLGTLLSGSSTDQILGAGLKALIDQNKIIIRQNELMLRVLSRNKDNQESPRD
jgi:hypothetical protein